MLKRRKSFDWYGAKQRFSIRKYHFGAASVLLGLAISAGLGAHEVRAEVTTSEVAKTAEDLSAKKSSVVEDIKRFALKNGTDFIKRINEATNRDDISKIFDEAVATYRAKLAAEKVNKDVKEQEVTKVEGVTPMPVASNIALRKLSAPTYKNAVAQINNMSQLTDIEKSYYIGEIAKLTKGVINRDKQVEAIVAEADAHNQLIEDNKGNRGQSEDTALENEVAPNSEHSVSGNVRLTTGGKIANDTEQFNAPLANVDVYAQWYEKDGYASPIYKAKTNDKGEFSIGMAAFIGADGKKHTFKATAALPSGEKWRVWSTNPDLKKYTLLYSSGEEQISPEGKILDRTAQQNQDVAKGRLFDLEIRYTHKTDDVWRQEATKTDPLRNDEGGSVQGAVYWNNNVPAGRTDWAVIAEGLTSREKKQDIGIPNINVYASYLSDYAVAELNKMENLNEFVAEGSSWNPTVNADGSSNIRDNKTWTKENEEKLRQFILKKVKTDRSRWIAETVTTQTDAKGEFKLQFKGTWGQEWNLPGDDKAAIKTNRSIFTTDKQVTVNGVTKAAKDFRGEVAPNAEMGTFTGAGYGTAGANDLTNAIKHVNLEWLMVTTDHKDGVAFTNAYYGDVPKGKGLWGGGNPTGALDPNLPDWGLRVGNGVAANSDYVKNVRFAAFNDQLVFDVHNYDAFAKFAAPGDVAKVKTSGLTVGSGNYQIVWKDEAGKEVGKSGVLQVNPDGSLEEQSYTVPADLKETKTYFAELYALDEDGTLPEYPMMRDAFTARYAEKAVYKDTETDKGVELSSQAPKFDAVHTKENIEENDKPAGTTFALLEDAADDKEDNTVTIPAADGKAGGTFVINKDTGVITWQNPTGEAGTSVELEVAVTDKTGVVDVVKATFKIKDIPHDVKYDPSYEAVTTKPGGTVTSNLTFKDKDGKEATIPANTAFKSGPVAKLGAVAEAPAGTTVQYDAITGQAIITVPSNADAGEYGWVTEVTYPDGTKDYPVIKLTVEKPEPLTTEYEPTYPKVEGPAGSTVKSIPEFKNKEDKKVDVPEKTTFAEADDTDLPNGKKSLSNGTISVDPDTGEVEVAIEKATAPGNYAVPVKVTYSDGSSEIVVVDVTVTPAIEKDADKYTPTYQDVTAKPGESVDSSLTFKNKDGKEVATPADTVYTAAPLSVLKNIQEVPAKTQVTYDATTGKATVQVPADADPGEYGVPVEITYKDGTKDTTFFKLTVVKPDIKQDELTVETEKAEVVDKKPVEKNQLVVKPSKPASEIKATETSEAKGLSVDNEGNLTGTPKVDDWKDGEEQREVNIPVSVTNGSEKKDVIVQVTILRDTDGDGIPDSKDDDDDNDGYPDDKEKDAGTNPKDPNSKPTVTYPEAVGKPGETVISTPVVKGKDDKVVNIPAGTTFEHTDDSNLPTNTKVTVDKMTGKVTVELPIDAQPSDAYTVAVKVTYPGTNTAETVNVPVKVKAADEKDTDKYQPNYPDIVGKPGTTLHSIPELKDKVGKVVNVPANTKFSEGYSSDLVEGEMPLPEGSVTEVDEETGKVTVTLPKTAKSGDYKVPVQVTYPDNTKEIVKVSVNVLPTDADTYNPVVIPEVVEQGGKVDLKDNIEPIKDDKGKTVDVKVKDITPAGTIDTNKPGSYKGKVEVIYPDGSSEEVDVPVTVKAKAETPRTISEIADQTVIEHKPLTPIMVSVNGKQAGDTVNVSGLPTGVTYDETTGQISGTPTVSDWDKDKETREFLAIVTVTDKNGVTVARKTFTITVQRDTDKDGKPDVTDPDDDNDGYPDDKEKDAGTNPKDPNSKPSDLGVVTESATAIENKPVEPNQTVVKPSKPQSTIVAVETNGLSVDKDGNLTGTPKVTDWGKEEEKRDIDVPVTVTNGTEKTESAVKVTILRDTDGDGIPDSKDDDDDNDGYPDDKEKDAGTNPKDPNSKPKSPTMADTITPKLPEKTPVDDVNNLTPTEKETVKKAIEDVNKFPEGTTIEIGKDGTATITYPDKSVDTIPGKDLVRPKTDAERITPVVPEKTPVENVNQLTPTEKETVKKAVEEANKGKFPEGTRVEIGNDGTATITYPDGSVDTIPGTELVKPKSPTMADTITPKLPEKTLVGNVNNLTPAEKAKVKKAIESVNKFPEGTVITIGNDGTATITYPDGSVDTISGKDLVYAKAISSKKVDNKQLPYTGSETTAATVALGFGMVGAAFGMFAKHCKKDEEA